jgi:cyclomaltodextrinase
MPANVRPSLLLALIPTLALAASASPARAGTRIEPIEGGARFRVTFSHQPVIAAQSVAVAGSWNGWSPTATPLRDDDHDGRFEVTIELPRGRHSYKFVLNGTTWQHDGDNPKTDADGHSGFNSVLDLGAQAAATPGRVGDQSVAVDQLLHDPTSLAFASALDGGRRLVLRLHVLRDDCQRVTVSATPRPLGGDEVACRKIAQVDGRDVWEARLAWSSPPGGRVRYTFNVHDGGATPTKLPAGREKLSVLMSDAGRFVTPDWVRDTIFYQVFPDRFRDGNAQNEPALPRRPAGRPWALDDAFMEAWDAEPTNRDFMGGDLAGVTEKADYLRDLGVNALYLNPIFAAASNHRYDAADYERIDPALGTLDDFHALRDALRARSMRMILDCVFNHTGDEHYAFQDCMQKGPASRYWGWYFFEGYPVVRSPKPNYRCWWNFGDLPQLNTANPDVVKHLLGVGKKWLEEGAQGWRLDVPNEVDAVNPEFWPEFRRRVKKQDPDAYIVGEIWTDARDWLKGDKFDAVMNYPVRSAALELLGKPDGIDAPAFASALTTQLATYPEAALRVQFNLLGSHDTPRLRTVCGGDARRARLCFSFLFAWPGAPVVYYGDEVGLLGGKDPECRRTYPWDHPDKQDLPTLEHVRALCHVRTAEPALRRGTVRFLLTDGKLVALVREPEPGDRGRPVVVILNASGTQQTVRVPLDGLTGEPHALLGAQGAKLEGGALVVEVGALEAAYVALGE